MLTLFSLIFNSKNIRPLLVICWSLVPCTKKPYCFKQSICWKVVLFFFLYTLITDHDFYWHNVFSQASETSVFWLGAHVPSSPSIFFLFTDVELTKPNRPTQIICCLGRGECTQLEQILSVEIQKNEFQFDTQHQWLTVHQCMASG